MMDDQRNTLEHVEEAQNKRIGNSNKKKAINKELKYSSKIIKAGALIADTKALLSVWDPELSVSENIERVKRQNLMAKTSRSRAEDILTIFKQRYLADEAVAQALAIMVKRRSDANTLERILYFHAARSDTLLRDVVVELLLPQLSLGIMDIDSNQIESTLRKWVKEGKTAAPWGDSTIRRVTQGVLSTLRDFGVLKGAVNKRIAPAYLPLHAFAYIVFYLKQHQPSGAILLDHDDWKLFFLSHEGIERFFLEAHQQELLEYHVAGSVTRLTFPAETLEEYANVITR